MVVASKKSDDSMTLKDFPVYYLDDKIWATVKLTKLPLIIFRILSDWQLLKKENRQSRMQFLKFIIFWNYALHFKPDLVHIHHLHSAKEPLIRLLSALSIPWIVSLRGHDVMVSPLMSEEERRRARFVLNEATAIHAISNALKKRAVELGAKESKISVIYRSLETEGSPSKQSRPRSPYQLTSIGRFVWEKGHLYALDAAASLIKEGIAVKYRIAGEGPLEEAIRFRIWQLGIESSVEIFPFLDSEGVDKLLLETDVLLQPSLTEGLSNLLIRAQAMGIPAIASNVGGIAEVVQEKVCLVPPADPQAIVEAAKKLLFDQDLWQRCSRSAVETAAVRFSPEKEIASFVALYQSLVRN